jgi:hypothetical protein
MRQSSQSPAPSRDRRIGALALLTLLASLALVAGSLAAPGHGRGHKRLGGAHRAARKPKRHAPRAQAAPTPAGTTAPTAADPGPTTAPASGPAPEPGPATPDPAAAPAGDPEPAPPPTPEPAPEPDPTPVPSPGPNPEPEPASHSLYWGAWIEGATGEAPWRMAAASDFEQLLGKPLSLIHWSSPFELSGCGGYCGFQTAQFDAVRAHGSIPFFSWNPGPGAGAFTDAAIAAGSQDAYIRAWAEAAKRWGHPFFLRFAWEMNGPWFPWGVGNGGTTAADYVAMWRHVHDLFSAVGAGNATWVWCPNVDPYGHRTPMASVYPGDAYVDWTCLDGYNGANPWRSFGDLFRSSYATIAGQIAADKPMIVAETASTESGGDKAGWIDDMFAALPSEFPQVRGLMWFDKAEPGPGERSDWPLESSTAASAAFAAGLRSPDFVGNNYGDLENSPISAP